MTQKNFLQHLERRDQLSVRYALTVAVICFLPVATVTAFAAAVGAIQIDTSKMLYSWPIPAMPVIGVVVGIFDVIFLTPLVETAMVVFTIMVLRWLRFPAPAIPYFSALIWGMLHARNGNWVGIIQAWPFFCFTRLLLNYEKPSLNRAWLFVSIVHSAHNISALLIAYLFSLIR